MNPFFGELYLRSTLPFLLASRTEQEADYLAEVFSKENLPEGPILDLCCGHGRHLKLLQQNPSFTRSLIGLDNDALSLQSIPKTISTILGDMLKLPFEQDSLAGVYSWYSSLFLFDDENNKRVLEQINKCLKPGGLLLFHTLSFEYLCANPKLSFEVVLAELEEEYLYETYTFDATTGLGTSERTLTTPTKVLTGKCNIRYHPIPELKKLLADVGFVNPWFRSFGKDNIELAVGAYAT
jgi:SAM-dependent methyltransferase